MISCSSKTPWRRIRAPVLGGRERHFVQPSTAFGRLSYEVPFPRGVRSWRAVNETPNKKSLRQKKSLFLVFITS